MSSSSCVRRWTVPFLTTAPSVPFPNIPMTTIVLTLSATPVTANCNSNGNGNGSSGNGGVFFHNAKQFHPTRRRHFFKSSFTDTTRGLCYCKPKVRKGSSLVATVRLLQQS